MSNRFSVLGFVRTNIGVVSSSREECPSRFYFRKEPDLPRQMPEVLEVLEATSRYFPTQPPAHFVPDLAGCSLSAIEPVREASRTLHGSPIGVT
jgi:hypothetical protein